MTRPVILLLESIHPGARAVLEEAATVYELEEPDAPLGHIPLESVTGLVTRGRGQVTPELLDQLGSLRVVARAGVGLDNVDRVAAAIRNVTVINVPHALTATVAEHAVALALAARREIASSAAAAKAGRWSVRDSYGGASVGGARVTVVGLGAIGARAAALFRALGADVVTWNRSPRSDAGFEPSLPRALRGAGVVSLHGALTEDTRGSIGAAELAELAPGATLVNTARPGLVHRGALLEALELGQVGAYAVDGFDPEPPPADDALLSHPKVLVTPHVAALTEETYSGLCLAAAEGVLDGLAGRDPAGGAQVVPPVRDPEAET